MTLLPLSGRFCTLLILSRRRAKSVRLKGLADVPTPGHGQGAGPGGDKFLRSKDAGNAGRGRSAAASKRGERSSSRALQPGSPEAEHNAANQRRPDNKKGDHSRGRPS